MLPFSYTHRGKRHVCRRQLTYAAGAEIRGLTSAEGLGKDRLLMPIDDPFLLMSVDLLLK